MRSSTQLHDLLLTRSCIRNDCVGTSNQSGVLRQSVLAGLPEVVGSRLLFKSTTEMWSVRCVSSVYPPRKNNLTPGKTSTAVSRSRNEGTKGCFISDEILLISDHSWYKDVMG